jgi:uncharacterized cupredoxin-like copper-binding protein
MWRGSAQSARARGLLCGASIIAAAALGGGCGGSAHHAATASLVNVVERDFHISAPVYVRAGEVHFAIHNQGPDRHELIVVREDGTHLPLRTDGLTVNEERLKPVTAGGIEPSPPLAVRGLSLHLPPGRYVLFCNMFGHYLGGMHTEIVVGAT